MPRKSVDQTPVPPGPVSVELRVGPPGATKIAWSQNTYGYAIDQQPDKVTITVSLRPEPTSIPPVVPVEAPVVEDVAAE
jgi:hypothetical protein